MSMSWGGIIELVPGEGMEVLNEHVLRGGGGKLLSLSRGGGGGGGQRGVCPGGIIELVPGEGM